MVVISYITLFSFCWLVFLAGRSVPTDRRTASWEELKGGFRRKNGNR